MKLLHVPSKKEIGKTIHRARRRKGLSQDKLAELVGAKSGRFTVISWESGEHAPTLYRDQIAIVLEIPVAEITPDEPEPDLLLLMERLDIVAAEEREIRQALEEALAQQGSDGSAPE